MNYIGEINGFYVWLVENPIPGNAQALWHRLMAYCNAFCWKDDFTITNTRLIEDLNISRQELDRVRNILVQLGRIKYKKGVGSRCGSYTIIPFVSQKTANPITQVCHNPIHKPDTSLAQPNTQTWPLDKLNETKQNIYYDRPPQDESVSKLIRLFAEVNGDANLNSIVGDGITDWHSRLGAELVEHAIRHCAKGGRKPWGYLEKVLISWHEQGFKTVADVEDHEQKRIKQTREPPSAKPINPKYSDEVLDRLAEMPYSE